MILSDSLRILGRNHHILWRLMIYILVCVLVVGGLSLAICSPLISELSKHGFFSSLEDLFVNLTFNFDMGNVFDRVYTFLVGFGDLVKANLATMLPFLIVFVTVFTLGVRFTVGLAELPVVDYVYNSMASNTRLSFGVCFIKNLKKSVKLQLCKLCVAFPVDLLILCAGIGGLLAFQFDIVWLNVLLPILWLVGVMLLVSFKQTLFGLWTPFVAIFEEGCFASFAKSFKALKGNFCAVFGRVLLISFLCVVLNYLLVILTMAVGLIFVVPVEFCVFLVFGLVMTFYLNGLRFYVTEKEIISPKKKENWERVSSLKDII